MGTLVQTEIFERSIFEFTQDNEYTYTLTMRVQDLDTTDWATAAADAIATSGYTIGDAAPAPYDEQGLEVVNIKVKGDGADAATVYVQFGTPVVRLTTADSPSINWTYETQATVRPEQQAWDVNGDPIRVKYWPPNPDDVSEFMSETDWNKPGNQWKFNRTSTAQKYRPWVTAVYRCRLTKDWVEKYESQGWHPRRWSALLSGKVNDRLYPDMPEEQDFSSGVWMCQGCWVSTQNNGQVWDVRVQFVQNDYGWDNVLFYQNPTYNNFAAKEIADLLDETIPSNAIQFKLPFPDADNRQLQATNNDGKPFGAVRPQMHELYDFNVTPINIDLSEVDG